MRRQPLPATPYTCSVISRIDLRGSAYRNPVAGVAFTVGPFSMVGLPFLGGFITKVNLGSAALSLGALPMALVMVALAVSTALNTIYFLKTVITIYRADADMPDPRMGERYKPGFAFQAAMAAFIAINLFLGTFSAPVIELIRRGLNLFA